MNRFLRLCFFAITCLFFAVSCQNTPAPSTKMVSFDPADSLLVDELMRFYVENHIIPEEAIATMPENGALFTFDCLSENCFVSHDYLQDSLSGTFFTEVEFETGSSGNNAIYVCRRSEAGFEVLLTTEGQIQNDLGTDTLVNGYKVLYISTQEQTQRLFFNGNTFVTEEFLEIAPETEEQPLTSN